MLFCFSCLGLWALLKCILCVWLCVIAAVTRLVMFRESSFLLVCWKSWEIGITHLTGDQAVLWQLSRKFVPNTVSIIRLLPNYVTTKIAGLWCRQLGCHLNKRYSKEVLGQFKPGSAIKSHYQTLPVAAGEVWTIFSILFHGLMSPCLQGRRADALGNDVYGFYSWQAVQSQSFHTKRISYSSSHMAFRQHCTALTLLRAHVEPCSCQTDSSYSASVGARTSLNEVQLNSSAAEPILYKSHVLVFMWDTSTFSHYTYIASKTKMQILEYKAR